MPTVTTTPGSASANSYCSVDDADAYHGDRLHVTDWTGASTDTKQRALIMATRLLDDMFDWASLRTDEIQALEWPRSGLIAANRREQIEDDEIPNELRDATAELARQLIAEDRSADNEAEAAGLKSLEAGPVSLAFRDRIVPKVIPDAVFYMIPEWWYHSVKSRQSSMARLERC